MNRSNATAVILILHGSPKGSSSEPAEALAEELNKSEKYAHVMLAFMECNSPTIPEAVEECAALDVRKIIAVPYLLHMGRHLVLDIPGILLDAAAVYPQVEVLLTEPVGAVTATSDALAMRGAEASKC